jgi:hypothetical protein
MKKEGDKKMNAYELNGRAGGMYRKVIVDGLKINHIDIYKEVKRIDYQTGVIYTKDGKMYEMKLVEINLNN